MGLFRSLGQAIPGGRPTPVLLEDLGENVDIRIAHGVGGDGDAIPQGEKAFGLPHTVLNKIALGRKTGSGGKELGKIGALQMNAFGYLPNGQVVHILRMDQM